MKLNNKLVILLLGLIVFISFSLRVYRLDDVPPSLSWDEAAVGYNAYTIANFGRDEWGRFLPVYFKSFEDDKNPVHIYLTALSVKILGLNEFATRFPMALFGTLNVLVIFFLGKYFFKNNLVGIFAAIVFAISPYTLQFSRFNHEAIITLFFFMFGLWMFFESITRRPSLLPLSFISFGISILSYHSAKVVVPLMILLLCILYLKTLWKVKINFILSICCLGLILSLFIFNPELLGVARSKQSSISEDIIKQTAIYQKTQNINLGKAELFGQRYLTYFSTKYLFISGDEIARHSSQGAGEFYKIDFLFLVIGLLGLVFKRSKESSVVLIWAILGPLPGSIAGGVSETAHAARALFTMGSWHLVAAFGIFSIWSILRKPYLQIAALVFILGFITLEFKSYLINYYQEYPKRYAIEWQYGMKQTAEYLREHNGYFRVYMTDARSQPYIFFLYYLKTPLSQLLETVEYNETKNRPSNLVSVFDKYHFGDWEPLESMPNPGFLYVLTPSQYDGLRHKSTFDVKKIIRYPNGLDAYFLVSYP